MVYTGFFKFHTMYRMLTPQNRTLGGCEGCWAPRCLLRLLHDTHLSVATLSLLVSEMLDPSARRQAPCSKQVQTPLTWALTRSRSHLPSGCPSADAGSHGRLTWKASGRLTWQKSGPRTDCLLSICHRSQQKFQDTRTLQ